MQENRKENVKLYPPIMCITADEKRMSELPFHLGALLKITHTTDPLQLPAQSL